MLGEELARTLALEVPLCAACSEYTATGSHSSVAEPPGSCSDELENQRFVDEEVPEASPAKKGRQPTEDRLD